MPYKIEYRDDDLGVITTYSGTLTEAEFLDCTKEKFASLDKLNNYRYSISDFSAVTRFEIPLDVIRENAMLSSHALKVNQTGVMAVAVNTDLIYGLGSLWKGNTGDISDRVGIFRSREDAEDWVQARLSENEARPPEPVKQSDTKQA